MQDHKNITIRVHTQLQHPHNRCYTMASCADVKTFMCGDCGSPLISFIVLTEALEISFATGGDNTSPFIKQYILHTTMFSDCWKT